MNIAIIGAGDVGRTLARRWLAGGHVVTFAARDLNSDKVRQALELTAGRGQALPVAPAVAAAEIVVLATQYKDAAAAVRAAGALNGKIIIDATNPLKPDLSGLSMRADESGAEAIAALAPEARVVKAFNTTGFAVMNNPAFPHGSASMFICGNDADARRTVSQLAREIGFEAIDVGDLSTARLLESLAMLWIHLAFKQGLGREFAFALLRR